MATCILVADLLTADRTLGRQGLDRQLTGSRPAQTRLIVWENKAYITALEQLTY